MKLFAALILTCSGVLFSCSKTSFSISNSDINGTWKLIASSGGITGATIYPTDDRTITFERSGNYYSSINDTVVSGGNYNFSKAGDINYYSGNTLINLNVKNGTKITYGIALSNDSLLLDEGCCDRFSYLYIKQK